MNDKGLDVMEKILQSKHVTAISREKALELIAEVRRLNETNGQLKHRETYRDNNVIVAQLDTIKKERNFREKLQQENKLYKEQNMVYKVALEKHISILRSVLQVIKNQIDYDEGIALGGVIVQLEKALEKEVNKID